MDASYFARLSELEEGHWWHATRRALVVDQLQQLMAGDWLTPRILDLGCGTGRLLMDLAALGQAIGVELSEDALALCRSRGHMNVIKATLLELPLADESIDLVTALDVLEHIQDDRAALRQCYRVLRPGGAMIILVPAHPWLWSLQDEVSHHCRRYTRRSLADAVTAANFCIERLTYINGLLLPVVVLGRLWLRVLLRFRDIPDENDLHPAWANGLLRRIFHAEIPIVRRRDLPAGASLLCIAKRPLHSAERDIE